MNIELSEYREFDDHLSLLIGRIVRKWSRFDENNRSIIALFHVNMRVRHRRALTPVNGLIPPATRNDFSKPPGEEAMTRIRHVRMLLKAFKATPGQLARFEKLVCEAKRLYDVRNDFGHGDVHLNIFATDDRHIELHSGHWREKALGKDISWSGPPESKTHSNPEYLAYLRRFHEERTGIRRYTFAALEEADLALDTLWIDLRRLVAEVPLLGPEIAPVEPPKRR